MMLINECTYAFLKLFGNVRRGEVWGGGCGGPGLTRGINLHEPETVAGCMGLFKVIHGLSRIGFWFSISQQIC
jgi:hypothetical protein